MSVLDEKANRAVSKYARAGIPVLVRQAISGRPIIYKEFANEIGANHARPMGQVLNRIGKALIELGMRTGEDIPPLTALVHNKATRLPSQGLYDEFGPHLTNWIGDLASFQRAPKIAKADRPGVLYSHMQRWRKWDWVLEELGLSPLEAEDISMALDEAGRYGEERMGKGEGEEHRRLKEYIAANPKVVGIKTSVKTGDTEYLFPTGDRADVSFCDEKSWTVVEVKPASAPEHDVLRGVFQCVKYHALMNAELQAKREQRETKVLLVLGGKQSRKSRGVVRALDISVHENIRIRPLTKAIARQ